MKKKKNKKDSGIGDGIIAYMNRTVTFEDLKKERAALGEAYKKHISPLLKNKNNQ